MDLSTDWLFIHPQKDPLGKDQEWFNNPGENSMVSISALHRYSSSQILDPHFSVFIEKLERIMEKFKIVNYINI